MIRVHEPVRAHRVAHDAALPIIPRTTFRQRHQKNRLNVKDDETTTTSMPIHQVEIAKSTLARHDNTKESIKPFLSPTLFHKNSLSFYLVLMTFFLFFWKALKIAFFSNNKYKFVYILVI
jgi:hypothetical protein